MEPNNIVAVDRATTIVFISSFLLAAAGHSVSVELKMAVLSIDFQCRLVMRSIAKLDGVAPLAFWLKSIIPQQEQALSRNRRSSARPFGRGNHYHLLSLLDRELFVWQSMATRREDDRQYSDNEAECAPSRRTSSSLYLCGNSVLWTALVVPMIYCSICVRSLFFALGTAALVGLLAGIVREVVIGREDY